MKGEREARRKGPEPSFRREVLSKLRHLPWLQRGGCGTGAYKPVTKKPTERTTELLTI